MRKLLLLLLIPVALFLGWMYWLDRWAESLAPAGTTLAEHLENMPAPDYARKLTVAGRDYLFLENWSEPLPRFPSGPAVYVFDDAGKLVEWELDIDEIPEFHERWPGYQASPRIAPEKCQAWPGGK